MPNLEKTKSHELMSLADDMFAFENNDDARSMNSISQISVCVSQAPSAVKQYYDEDSNCGGQRKDSDGDPINLDNLELTDDVEFDNMMAVENSAYTP